MAQPARNRYSNSPRVAAKEDGDERPATNPASFQAGASDRAPPTTESEGAGGEESGAPEKDYKSGTESVPMAEMHEHGQHSHERNEAHARHMHAHMAMHHRHHHEHHMRVMGQHHESHEEMNKRHHAERKALHSAHEHEMKQMHERHHGGGMVREGGGDELGEGKAEERKAEHVDKGPSIAKDELKKQPEEKKAA